MRLTVNQVIILEAFPLFTFSRSKHLESNTLDLLHSAVGISGEAGEFIDAVKKTWVYGKELDKENALEELGDILFYIQMAANGLGTSIPELVERVTAKLAKRYPTGYTDSAAIARADKQ